MADASVPPSDLPALAPGDYHELRVHGVAGTTPESMLGLAATMQATGTRGKATAAGCPVDAPPGDVSVWEPPAVQPELRAFSWSSLTSGHWYQAFYLVLLPFMIANLAGWMIVARAPVGRTWTVRLSALLVRVIGLLVTGVFVVSIQIVVADLVVFQWLRPGRWLALGTPATVAVLLGAVVLSRIRQAPNAVTDPWRDFRDPVGTCSLQCNQPRMWDSPGINVTLRQLHLAAGLAAIALLAAWPGPGVGPEPVTGPVARVLAMATGAVAVGMLARISLGNGTSGVQAVMGSVRWLSVPAGLAVVAATAYQFGLSPDVTRSWATLPGLRGAMVWIAVAVLVGIVVLAVVGLGAGKGRWAAVNAPSVLLLAVSIGAMFGAGLAGQVVRFTGAGCGAATPCPVTGEYVTWLAVGVTTSLAGLVAVAVVRGVWFAVRAGDWRVAVHRMTANGYWITAVLLVEGVVVLVVGLLAAFGVGVGVSPAVTAVIQVLVVVFLVGPVVAGAVLVAWNGPARGRRRANLPADRKVWLGRAAALLVLVGLGYVVVGTTWTYTLLGVALPPRTFTDLALDIAVVLPGAAVLTRIYSGLTKVGVRRGVGVLWDVGTFWPRWFHPLAPPTYSDRAVRQLITQIDRDLNAGHRMLLAPHSQGAVIAAAAVLGGKPELDRSGLAMLSYGSPWSHLYSVFFPLYADAAATRAVVDRLGGAGALRWRNLHRVTDPIGGAIPGVPEASGRPDPCHRGHSDYWVEDYYVEAAGELRELLGSTDNAPPTCSASVTATSNRSRSGRRTAVDEVST